MVDLYEDKKYGSLSNKGTYNLEDIGDVAYFCFHVDRLPLVEVIQNLNEKEKEQKKK